jgi:hypothetical protein
LNKRSLSFLKKAMGIPLLEKAFLSPNPLKPSFKVRFSRDPALKTRYSTDMCWILIVLCLCTPVFAEPPDRQCSNGQWGQTVCIRFNHYAFDTCQALRDVSRTHDLDTVFFTRLIWQESRFDPNALSTANAQGIAQFIPSTAKLRGLSNPYNPALALDHSAQYLAELVDRFGNVGMAAVAYNGGETRATNFIAKTNGLASKTMNYVQIITGQSAEDWRDTPPKSLDLALQKDKPFMSACLELAKKRSLSKIKSLNPKPKLPAWGVQMATGSTRAKASVMFKRNARACSNVIDGRKPNYIKKSPQVAGRKAYYVARLGAKSRGSAQKLCNCLRKFNCVCVVFKN